MLSSIVSMYNAPSIVNTFMCSSWGSKHTQIKSSREYGTDLRKNRAKTKSKITTSKLYTLLPLCKYSSADRQQLNVRKGQKCASWYRWRCKHIAHHPAGPMVSALTRALSVSLRSSSIARLDGQNKNDVRKLAGVVDDDGTKPQGGAKGGGGVYKLN